MDLDARFQAGCARLAAGDLQGAAAIFVALTAAAPDFPGAWANLAYLAEQAGEAGAAEAGYRRALALAPDDFQLHINLGSLYLKRRDLAQAGRCYQEALRLAPDQAAPWAALGVWFATRLRAEAETDDFDGEAEACYRTALALEPGHRRARFNLGYLLLRGARYREGWAAFEARDWYQGLASHFEFPRWQGEALTGRRVVVGPEVGCGDMIQFARYLPYLKQSGAAWVSVVVPPSLVPLLETVAGVDEVLPQGESVPRRGWDFWLPMLSLPHLLYGVLPAIPAQVPYLSSRPAARARWRDWLAARAGPATLRVGLVWQGNPAFENDGQRSLSGLAVLAPLGQLPGIAWVSLQVGAPPDAGAAAAPPPGLPILDAGPLLTDFSETAALVEELDLVISVDTAVAHLTGALGRPGWVLLPHYLTDWRWQKAGEESPWYPSLRLFRQPVVGGWPAVVDRLLAALGTLRPGPG